MTKIEKEKYRISPDQFGCWGPCVVSSRAGNRFAILERGETLETRIMNHINFAADTYETDKKAIRVYNTQDGKKLFQVSWRENQNSHANSDESERVAFSDDGAMVAFLDDDGNLHIVRLSTP